MTRPLRIAALFAVAAVSQTPLAAQQFATDDVQIVAARACQLEAWHGAASSWVLPACRANPPLELALGIGWLEVEDERTTEGLVQLAAMFREPTPDGWGVGFVAGLGIDPRRSTGRRRRLPSAYAYVPFSVSTLGGRLLLHQNAGWQMETERATAGGGGSRNHALSWATRGDLRLLDGLMLIGELFGAGRSRPEYQLGLSGFIQPDRFAADLSYGGHTARGEDGAGWTVGVSWTPPPFR